jgi:hypothetical protein
MSTNSQLVRQYKLQWFLTYYRDIKDRLNFMINTMSTLLNVLRILCNNVIRD